MGSTKKGLLADVSGKVGAVVASSWKGKSVIKSLPRINKNRKSIEAHPDGSGQQAKFRTVIGHIKPMSDFISNTFTDVKGERTAFNAAMANGTILQFTWSTLIGPNTSPGDKVILVAYCPALYICYQDIAAFTQQAGTGIKPPIYEPSYKPGKRYMHLYRHFRHSSFRYLSYTKFYLFQTALHHCVADLRLYFINCSIFPAGGSACCCAPASYYHRLHSVFVRGIAYSRRGIFAGSYPSFYLCNSDCSCVIHRWISR